MYYNANTYSLRDKKFDNSNLPDGHQEHRVVALKYFCIKNVIYIHTQGHFPTL